MKTITSFLLLLSCFFTYAQSQKKYVLTNVNLFNGYE
ncbi:MAG: hypothetical protein RI909_1087, partial [Bacteroidota bacterium]